MSKIEDLSNIFVHELLVVVDLSHSFRIQSFHPSQFNDYVFDLGLLNRSDD